MVSLNEVIKDLVKLFPAIDGVLDSSDAYFKRLADSAKELRDEGLDSAAAVFEDALSTSRRSVKAGTEKLAALLQKTEGANRVTDPVRRVEETNKALDEVATFVGRYAKDVQSSISTATRVTDIAVQYAVDADRDAAHIIADGIGAVPIMTTDILKLSPYNRWIFVGGQNVNPLFAAYTNIGWFKDVVEGDKGNVFIQYHKTTRRELFGCAGWTKQDTAKSAEHLVANWPIKETVKTPWVTEIDLSGLIIDSFETGNAHPELAGLQLPVDMTITQQPISWDEQGKPVFPPIGEIKGSDVLILLGVTAGAILLAPIAAGLLAPLVTGSGIALGSRGSVNLLGGLSARAPAAFIKTLSKSPKKVVDTFLSWSPKVRNGFMTNMAKTPSGKLALDQLKTVMAKQTIAAAGKSSWLPGIPNSVVKVLGAYAAAGGLASVLAYMLKEVPEKAGIPIWAMIEREMWEDAKEALGPFRDFIKPESAFVDTFKWPFPWIGLFGSDVEAANQQADLFEKIINDGLAEANSGTIEVKSSPDKADIMYNGKLYTFKTNSVLKQMPAGHYVVTVKKGELKPNPETCEFDLAKDETKVCEFTFEEEKPDWKTLNITGPINSEFEINGTYLGRLPYSDVLPPGTYRIKVYHPDYTTTEKDVVLGDFKDETYDATFDMKKLKEAEQRSATHATIGFDVPEGTKIIIDGIPQTFPGSQTVSLLPGSHDIKMSHSKFGTLEFTDEYKAGEVKSVVKTPDDFTPVEVRITETKISFDVPEKTKIFIDGVVQDFSGSQSIEVAPGTRAIKLTHKDFGKFETTVDAVEGETVPLEVGQAQFSVVEAEKPEPTKYGVTFRTEPAGAKISIDGVFTEKFTPDRILLEAGTYRVAYDKFGFDHYEADAEIPG